MNEKNIKDNKKSPFVLLTVFIAFVVCILSMIAAWKIISVGFEDIHEKKVEKLKEYEVELPKNYIYSEKYKNHSTVKSSSSFMKIELESGKSFQISEKYEEVLINSNVYIFKEDKSYFACFKNEIKTKCYFAFHFIL